MRVWLVVSLALGAALVGAALSVKPVLRATLESEAARRGMRLEMRALEVGWGTVALKGAQLEPVEAPFFHAQLPLLRLRLGLSAPRLRSVEVLGGEVEVSGTFEEVREGLARLRREPRATSSGGSGSGRFVVVRNVNVTWTNALERGERHVAKGVAMDLGPGGSQMGADWLRVETPGVALELAGAIAQASGAGAGTRLALVKAAEARLSITDGPSEASPITPTAPSEAKRGQGTGRDSAPPGGVPAAASKARGGAQDEPGLLARFRVDPALSGRLAAGLALLRRDVFPKLPAESTIERLWVTYERGAERLEIGPSRLQLVRSPADLRLHFEPGQGATGTPLTLDLSVPVANEDLRLELKGGPISLGTLGIAEGTFGLEGVRSAEVLGSMVAHLNPTEVRFSGSSQLRRLTLANARIAPEALHFPSLRFSGQGRAFLDGAFLEIHEGELDLGAAKFSVELGWRRTEEHAELAFELKTPMAPCQTWLDAAPRGLLGPLEGARLTGTFGLDLGVDADTRKLSQMGVGFQLRNECRVMSVPATLSPERFKGVFSREVPGPNNLPMTVESGPGSPSWVSYDAISRYFETALLVTEDGRFFRHHGFDERAIESSLRDNVTAGRFVRGASTISMQLAKNLYLERTKTLSRKLQEAFFTLLLEQSFDKRGLLELYMNVIELGPGIYGIKDAARYYFNVAPAVLSAAQCFFLASVLPAPTRQYFTADGKLTEGRKKHIERLLRIAYERERLSQAELDRALAEELTFGGSPPNPGAELDEGGLPLLVPGQLPAGSSLPLEAP